MAPERVDPSSPSLRLPPILPGLSGAGGELMAEGKDEE